MECFLSSLQWVVYGETCWGGGVHVVVLINLFTFQPKPVYQYVSSPNIIHTK